ncbi:MULTISPECIES: G5 domain-containing protein [unclassified Streptococcus]|uniref:G5 domain-containing protein n=1 Tax=unclassified Streptococcus TaxID=2608887 RepID=UPI00107224DD|nr:MULTISPECIES: G5 domain-containing protein [unclassified Streptococcus]MBF0806402.1 G5 domain-containing protein [Streptococcus sp. 19428wA2_WM07]TFU27962.1 YSIRK-type signal peptide-containing protein [Streptococcus sp. WM07]
MKKYTFNRQVQRFSLRKYSYGTASVLLGTFLFAGQNVQADSAAPVDTDSTPASASAESTAPQEASVYVAEPVLPATPRVLEVEATPVPEASTVETTEDSAKKPAPVEADSTSVNAESVEVPTDKEQPAGTSAFRSAVLRAAQPGEVQVYSQSQSFSDKPGGTISDFKGYVVKSAHTPTTDNIRFEFDYTPTIAAGRTSEVPFVFSISHAANFKILQNSLKVNGQSVPFYKTDRGFEFYWSPSQKVRIGQKNRVEFIAQAVTRSIQYSNISPVIGTANTGTYKQFFDPLSGEAIVRNTTTGSVKLDYKTFLETIEEIEGPKVPEPKVETSAIPFTTEYKADESLEVNTQATEREGVDGEQTVTTTYKKEGTEIAETKGEPVVTKEPVAKIVKVGTKPTVVTETIEFKTVYQDDPSMKPTDPEVVVTEGKAGQKTTTTTYRLDEKTGTVTPNTPTEEVVVAAVDRVIRRGSGEVRSIPFKTVYIANDKLEVGTQNILQEGVEGSEKNTFHAQTGNGRIEITPNSKENVEVISKPQVIIVLVENSPGMLLDDVNKLSPLWDNLKDGDKLLWIRAGRIPETFENAKASFSVKGTDASIKALESVGDISAKDIPTRYGLSPEEIAGADLRLETDLYTTNSSVLNKNTSLKALLNSVGSRTISVNSRERDAWANRRYRHAEASLKEAGFTYKIDNIEGLLSVQPKTERQTVITYKPMLISIGDPSGQLQVKSASLVVGDEKISLPIDGGKVKSEYTPSNSDKLTIDYTVEGVATTPGTVTATISSDGQEVANASTPYDVKSSLEKVDPVNRQVEVGVKPKVEVTTIAFETTYEEDPNMKATDPEVVVTEGKEGQKTVTTTYSLDEKTGSVTPNAPTEEVVAAVNRVVRRGVGQESKIAFETTYVANENLEAGQQEVVTEGVEGVRQPNGTVSQEPVTKVVQVGTKPKVEVTTIAFETTYEEDPNMKATDPEVVVTEGKAGQKTVTITYSLDEKIGAVTPNAPTEEVVAAVNRVIRRGTGQESKIAFETLYLASSDLEAGKQQVVTAGVEGIRHPNGQVTLLPVNQVIQVGVKPKVEVTTIAFETVYQDDASMKETDPEVVVTEGKDGQKTVTTTYSLDSKTGQISDNTPTEVLVSAVSRVIRRGTGQDSSLPFKTVYLATTSLDAGQKQVVSAGVEGVRHPNGSITKEAVAELIQVGVKPLVVVETLPYQTVYQEDSQMKATDGEVLVQAGQAGQRRTTTTYVLDEKTGLVTAQPPVVEEVAARDQVIKRGVGQETAIPFTTVYLATAELEAGQKQVLVAGQAGLRHPNGSVLKEAVAELVQVGVKPLVVVEALPYQTVYQEDASMLATDSEVLVQAGQAGQRSTTTTYVLDEKTGLVTAQTPVVEVTAARDQVIKRGVGQNTEIPFTTVYLATTELEAGQQQVLVAGQAGLRHPNGSVTREMLPAMIQVGTKPLVVTEVLKNQTVYQEDASMLATDPEVVVQAGQAGQRVSTTAYSLDLATGKVKALAPVVVETAAVDRVIKRGVGQTTTLPFATHYVADASLAAGEKSVRIAGQAGLRHPNGSIIKEVVAQIVAVGTRPSQRTETVAYSTRYLEAKDMVANSRRTLVEGQTGQKTYTVLYVLDSATGEVTAQPETESLTMKALAEVIEVGVQPSTRTADVAFATVYQEDLEMEAGKQSVAQTGQLGLDTYTTMYILDTATGQAVAQPETVERTTQPVTQLVRVGVKPLVVETELGFETVYQEDPKMLPTDKEVVLVEGRVGKETRTIRYVLNIQTGQVTAQEPLVERVEAVNRVVKRGVGQTSPIAFKVIYKGDVTLEAGKRLVDQEGQEGVRHPDGSVLKEAVDQLIRVGLKPVETVVEIPFEEKVVEDPTLPLGQICVEVEGVAGKEIKRITYTLDPETGEVTAHETVETVAAVTRLVRKGTKVAEVCPPEAPVVEAAPQEAEVKVLPNTGTSDSAGLLLAGGLAGLAGLGLAAKKREEDSL